MDTGRILRPLDDAAGAIDKLDGYESPTELRSALESTWQAVDRTLRTLLRSDPAAPDEIRLSALSPAELPHDRLIPALRQRNLISLQLAGMVHELELGARRAAAGEPRAADGDHALVVIARLREEIMNAGDQPLRTAAHNAVESGMLDLPVQAIPLPRDRQRWYRVLG